MTKEEMKQIVINANRAGLMYTGHRDWKEYWQEKGNVFGFCNCCAYDCYPIRAGIKIDLDNTCPCSYYIADRDMEKCSQGATCVQRCHFDAFYLSDEKVEIDGKMRREMRFDPGKCWGYGICATACPGGSIEMAPLPHTLELEA